MEIGGLMAYAFKVLLGNPDVLLVLSTWTILSTIVLVIFRLQKDYDNLKDGVD